MHIVIEKAADSGSRKYGYKARLSNQTSDTANIAGAI